MSPPQRLRFRNSSERALEFVLEPWGMPLELPPGATLELSIEGAEAPPELDHAGDRVVLYAASGSRIVAAIDGVEVYSTIDGPPVPATPAGTSMRSFVDELFGR